MANIAGISSENDNIHSDPPGYSYLGGTILGKRGEDMRQNFGIGISMGPRVWSPLALSPMVTAPTTTLGLWNSQQGEDGCERCTPSTPMHTSQLDPWAVFLGFPVVVLVVLVF